MTIMSVVAVRQRGVPRVMESQSARPATAARAPNPRPTRSRIHQAFGERVLGDAGDGEARGPWPP
jgi:hypothetical protein